VARKTKVVVVCDRHRGAEVEAVGSVEIALDGNRHKVDVCAEHLAEFRRLTRPWTGAPRARKATAKRAGPARARAADVGAIRAWARKNGHEISERGRIPNAVREAYAASATKKVTAGRAGAARGARRARS
jgi:hypothetical protein